MKTLKSIAAVAFVILLIILSSCSNDDTPTVKNFYFVGGEGNVPKYWKNGVATELTDGKNYADATAITVVGNDVYVAGNDYSVAKYWKNGIATVLNDGTKAAYAYAITVVGNDVYVAGDYGGLEIGVATYWKNGVATALTDGKHHAVARAITVVGNDVYVAGYEYNGSEISRLFNGAYITDGRSVAKFWKNGVATTLTDGQNNASANAITVVGDDVYVAGNDGNVAKYWKNGVANIVVPNASYGNWVTGMFITTN